MWASRRAHSWIEELSPWMPGVNGKQTFVTQTHAALYMQAHRSPRVSSPEPSTPPASTTPSRTRRNSARGWRRTSPRPKTWRNRLTPGERDRAPPGDTLRSPCKQIAFAYRILRESTRVDSESRDAGRPARKAPCGRHRTARPSFHHPPRKPYDAHLPGP